MSNGNPGTPRPVLIMNGVLAGVGVILGGSALAHYIGPDLLGLLLLIYSAVMVAWALITQSAVTPNAKIAALFRPQQEADGGVTQPAAIVAGPYIAARTGLSEGEPVDVVGKPEWQEAP